MSEVRVLAAVDMPSVGLKSAYPPPDPQALGRKGGGESNGSISILTNSDQLIELFLKLASRAGE